MWLGKSVPSFGPQPASILVVGEAPGGEETDAGRPFVGKSGKELGRMMEAAGLDLASCRLTNVFDQQPAGNLLGEFGVPRSEASSASVALGPLTTQPVLYVRDEFIPRLGALYDEIERTDPNLVLALGNTALWALRVDDSISLARGTVRRLLLPGAARERKLLATYHPAAILRQWNLRTVSIADFEKAKYEAAFPEVIYDNVELWLNPTIQDLLDFGRRYLEHATIISTDVETAYDQITCVGFGVHCADGVLRAIVCPFWVRHGEAGRATPNFWATSKEERIAWRWVQRYVEHPSIVKVLQNGLYDTQYFAAMGMNPARFEEDTMLLAHSRWSEMQKGLGFLGSVHTRYPAWKSMRMTKAKDILKRED